MEDEEVKIIKSGNHNANVKLRGECQHCGCEVECSKNEAATLIDRDTTAGSSTKYIKCPECDNTHLWVK